MNANIEIKPDGSIYWTGILAERLTREQLLAAFRMLAHASAGDFGGGRRVIGR